MSHLSDSTKHFAPLSARALRHPMIRIGMALLSIAIPFAVLAIPIDLYLSDNTLKKVGALVLAVVILVAYQAYVKVVEKREATELSGTGAIRELAVGLLLGTLLLSLTIGTLATLGVYQVTGVYGWLPMLATVPAFVMAAVLEEVVMRGVVFRILEQWLGSWIALVISATLFGALHMLNPGVTLLNAGAVMLEAGILLAAAFMVTRRLWLCIGIHFAWNFVQGGVFSAAVSGGATSGLLRARFVGPTWLTGGAFGGEASVVAVVVCMVAGVLLLFVACRRGHLMISSWSARPTTTPRPGTASSVGKL